MKNYYVNLKADSQDEYVFFAVELHAFREDAPDKPGNFNPAGSNSK